MKRLKYLQIVFDQQLQAYDLPKFRAAIIEKTKRESDLFHNHQGEEGFHYRYPLIQYKIKDRKPCIICLNDATNEIHLLLKQKDFKLNIGGKKYDLEIEDVRLTYINLRRTDEYLHYSILHYMALNQDNYKLYRTLDSLVEKISFLENMLTKHLQIFADEIEPDITQPVSVKILEIKEEKHIEYKENFQLTFTLNFKANIAIPDFVGLGKGVSVGFGIVKSIAQPAITTKNSLHKARL
jgi:hypothetical protein